MCALTNVCVCVCARECVCVCVHVSSFYFFFAEVRIDSQSSADVTQTGPCLRSGGTSLRRPTPPAHSPRSPAPPPPGPGLSDAASVIGGGASTEQRLQTHHRGRAGAAPGESRGWAAVLGRRVAATTRMLRVIRLIVQSSPRHCVATPSHPPYLLGLVRPAT